MHTFRGDRSFLSVSNDSEPFKINVETAKENKTDKPDKFLEFHRGIRPREGDTGPAYGSTQKWNQLKLARQDNAARKKNGQSRTKSNGVVEWKERGPANVPGRARALYNIPGDAAENTWLVGSATGGIWKTTNGGESWSERSGAFNALPISSFDGDPQGNVIYAGTGELVSSIFSAVGDGIVKSVDQGQTWTPLVSTQSNPDFSIVTRLVVNPTNANEIVATTAQSDLQSTRTSSIMRSSDGGLNWTKAKQISGIFEQIVDTPGNFNVLYASENGVGVWKSTDAGSTWNLSASGMSSSGRIEIAVSPVNTSVLFASSVGVASGTNSDLYRSDDAGASWDLVEVVFNGATVDFHQGQGFYDNTILCDPFNVDHVYIGGVSLFRTSITSGSTVVDKYSIQEVNTTDFLFLQSFTDIPFDNQRLDVGLFASNPDVEIRFGTGKSQKAHRFLVPEGATSGVAVESFAYTDYVTVPFEVWDITNNQQLMVSFRDQNRNGQFDLVLPALQTTDAPNIHSREYVYINKIDYADVADAGIAVAGGQEHQLAYNFFPALATGAVWNATALPDSKLLISNNPIEKLKATTVTVADGRSEFDNKNPSNQVNLNLGMHPDHHFLTTINVNSTNQTYRLLLANDGGVFVSKPSANPGTTNGDWFFRGNGLNTTQFYGADKAPGAERYIGGSQDNGTRISPLTSASSTSPYTYAIGGDGFEVLWNSLDANKIMGTIYNGSIYRSLDGGQNWAQSTSGFTPSDTEFSFVTKLANSKNVPDRVFTVGSSGVYVSNNFGGTWTLSPIASELINTSPFYLDVEVSRANANIVWAGSGMVNTGATRKLHVSVDGGATFAPTNNYTATTLGNITKLASHPTEPNTAYAVFSFAKGPKILRTTDLGQSWEDISGFGVGSSSTNGFPDVAVYCLYVHHNNPNVIWAGTEIGIVESIDNGDSWNLVEDFLNVSVWDMKGQDNEIVIATHGRGIWSAIMETSQLAAAPAIIASGTSPKEELVLRIELLETFESLVVKVDNATFTLDDEPMTAGIYDITLSGVTAGNKTVNITGFKSGAPYKSADKAIKQLDILPVKNSYSTVFASTTDFTLDGLSSSNFPGGTTSGWKALQTAHNYVTNKEYMALLRTPITVAASEAKIWYSDIAIIEPGKDYVILEATSNGIDWLPLNESYDAAFEGDGNGAWLGAYSSASSGTMAMFVEHEVNILNTFAAGDLLLFRLRMVSDAQTTSWGWAVNYLYIQDVPTSTEKSLSESDLTVYPNPARSTAQLTYTLGSASEVTVSVISVSGNVVQQKNLGQKQVGIHQEQLDLEALKASTYIVVVQTNDGRKTTKVSVIE